MNAMSPPHSWMMSAPCAAMMVAMMLPSIGPTLWCYYRRVRATGARRAAQRTALMACGYASVWTAIGVGLFALNGALAARTVGSPTTASLGPWAAALVVACAGALQRSRWKAMHLAHCRRASDAATDVRANILAALNYGVLLGVRCGASCAAPMAILFAVGLMDPRAMVGVTAAITAERLMPAGDRIARLTGTLALGAGLLLSVRAIL